MGMHCVIRFWVSWLSWFCAVHGGTCSGYDG